MRQNENKKINGNIAKEPSFSTLLDKIINFAIKHLGNDPYHSTSDGQRIGMYNVVRAIELRCLFNFHS